MPRSTFGVGMLDTATPGLSRLAQAFAGGDQAYQGGFDKGLTTQSKIAQAMAAINASNSAAAAHDSMARQNDAETGVLTGRPAVLDESLAAQTGTTLPMVQAFHDFLKTGQQQMKPAVGPVEEDGTQAAQFPVLDPASQTAIGKALARQVTMRTNLKDTTPESLAKATGDYRTQDLSDAIINGTANRNAVAGAQAASAGKDLYHFGDNGGVGDLFGGTLDESGGQARGNIALAGARAQEQRAAAGAQGALAGKYGAETAKIRAETTEGIKTGAIQVVPQDDGTVMLVNKATGIARPATTADGLPMKGKTAADKPLTETQGKATTFAARMQDAEGSIQTLEAQGIKGSDLRTRAAASDWTNWMASPEGQQYRQAQENWVTANLRQESGAAIGVNEMAKDVRKFFPTIGDSDQVIAQKAQSREVARRGMLEQAGPGAKRVDAIVNGPGGVPTAPRAPAAAMLSVQTPDGQTHTFPNLAAASAFKKAAGL